MTPATPNPAQAIPEYRLICRVCQKQYSKYTCPRCNLRYCSLPCYKNHSFRCIESFMRENVMEEMRGIQATGESQKSMMEALKRIHFDEEGRSIFEDESLADQNMEDDDSGDSHEAIFSENTLQMISEGGNISLDSLSVEERKTFLRAVAAGEISHLIQPWNPWWLNPRAKNISITNHGTSLVQPLNPLEHSTHEPRSEESGVVPGEVPSPPFEPLSKVRQLICTHPSPLLSVHLAEVIYSYCFTLRFCNGDWQSEPLEAALILLSVSQVLGQAASPESISVALSEALKTVCSPAFKHAGGFKFGVALFDDSANVLRLGRACVVCALAESHRMLEEAKKDLKAELGAQKLERVKQEHKSKPGGLDGSTSLDSTVKEKPSMGSGASQDSSIGVGRERGSQGYSYIELRRIRDKKRSSDGNKSSLSGECKLGTGSNQSQSSSSAGVIGTHKKQKVKNVELKKIEAAIRKGYFLLCWTNEQPDEIFLSIALLVDAEKNKLLETGGANNLELPVVNEVKASITSSGPSIAEIGKDRFHETNMGNKVDLPVVKLEKTIVRKGPIIEEV